MADCDHDWRWNLRDRRWDCARDCGTHAQGCGPCEGVGLEIIAKVAGIVVSGGPCPLCGGTGMLVGPTPRAR